MLRTLLSLMAAAPLLLAAQTYYYVNSIGVSPAAPTTADPVTITLFGDLSASNSYIIGTAQNVVGGQVQLTVNAGSQGIGLPVLVPHDESFSLGTLPAGTYTITIGGTATGDFAPAVQHQFTVSGGGGGSPCDSLTLSPLSWHPFTDTALVLSAANASSTLFDYPGFLLLDAQGDTLAMEQVNYFGIGQGPQTHVLAVKPGATIPPGAFTGDLELWTGFYQLPGCTWTDTFDLCPPAPCAPLQVWIGNTGGAIVTATFTYAVTDDLGNTLATGTLALTALDQVDTVDLCLPPGDLTLSMVQPNIVGGQLSFGVSTALAPGPSSAFVQGGAPNNLPFAYYPACFNGTNGVAEGGDAIGTEVRLAQSTLVITALDGGPVGPIVLYDAQGRLVLQASGPTNTFTLDASTLPNGLLFVQRTSSGGRRSVARVMHIR